MKRLALATAVLVAAVAVFVVSTIAPRSLVLLPFEDGTVPGVLHVHSNRSDGLRSPGEIAAFAARAGLKFIVFTDHGDATRVPDEPQYRSGVLCLDGVEISTSGGHYVAIGMPASPYPLGGEPGDVIDDVRRLGGFGIAAHPDSPKPQLHWNDWSLPFDGIETINLDTAWRLRAEQATASAKRWPARRALMTALVDYPFRPAETIGSLLAVDAGAPQWTTVAPHRRVVLVAGTDAHARLGLRGDPADTRWALPLPGYGASFRTLSVHVRPSRAFSGNATTDAALVVEAIRMGHLHTVIDSTAAPASFDFSASSGGEVAHEGDAIAAAGGPVRLRVRSNAPSGFVTTVWNGGSMLGSAHDERDFTVDVPAAAGVYWVDIRPRDRQRSSVWLSSNPIWIRWPPAQPAFVRAAATRARAIFDDKTTAGWRVEHDPTSLAAVETASLTNGGELRFRFGLAGGSLVGQVAALVRDTPEGIAGFDRLTFTIRAEKPMRVSVQLRDAGSRRWQRSVYVSTENEERTVYFDDFRTMDRVTTDPGGSKSVSAPLAEIRSVLFVVDTVNTKPGASARIWIRKPRFEQ